MNAGRRKFIGVCSGGILSAAGVGFSKEPLNRQGGNLIPALAAYSFRDQFPFFKGKLNPRHSVEKPSFNVESFIRFCAKHEVAAELTSYFFPPTAEEKDFTNCRRIAHINGVPISGTAVGNQFTLDPKSEKAAQQMAYVKKWIDRSVLMGAPHVRVFAGKIPKGMDETLAEKNAIEALAKAAEYAGNQGVLLGVENHDSIGSAEKLLGILKAVDNPWLGINLDSGNFRTDDPYADFAAAVPHSVNIQLKTQIKVEDSYEPIDIERVFRLIKQGGYSGYVALEYEENDDPFVEVPKWLKTLKNLSQKAGQAPYGKHEKP